METDFLTSTDKDKHELVFLFFFFFFFSNQIQVVKIANINGSFFADIFPSIASLIKAKISIGKQAMGKISYFENYNRLLTDIS